MSYEYAMNMINNIKPHGHITSTNMLSPIFTINLISIRELYTSITCFINKMTNVLTTVIRPLFFLPNEIFNSGVNVAKISYFYVTSANETHSHHVAAPPVTTPMLVEPNEFSLSTFVFFLCLFMSMFALAIVFANVLEDYRVYTEHAKKLTAKIVQLENQIQQLNKQDNCELLIKSHAQAFKQLQVVLNKRIIMQDKKLKKMDKEWKKYI